MAVFISIFISISIPIPIPIPIYLHVTQVLAVWGMGAPCGDPFNWRRISLNACQFWAMFHGACRIMMSLDLRQRAYSLCWIFASFSTCLLNITAFQPSKPLKRQVCFWLRCLQFCFCRTMTYGIKNVIGALALRRGESAKREGFFGTKKPLFGSAWKEKILCPSFLETGTWTLNDVWTYTWGAHASHALDFSAALLCYWLFYSSGTWLTECQEWKIGWVSSIFLYNLACEIVLCAFWHYFSYVSDIYETMMRFGRKLNPTNQYEPQTGKAGLLTSATGQLEREITFTTLGWLQSAFWQCLFTNLWARGTLPVYTNFWEYPIYSLGLLWLVAYWREIHFYCIFDSSFSWFFDKHVIWANSVYIRPTAAREHQKLRTWILLRSLCWMFMLLMRFGRILTFCSVF